MFLFKHHSIQRYNNYFSTEENKYKFKSKNTCRKRKNMPRFTEQKYIIDNNINIYIKINSIFYKLFCKNSITK